MHKHEHKEDSNIKACEHKCLHFCKDCSTVFCCDCKQEWIKFTVTTCAYNI